VHFAVLRSKRAACLARAQWVGGAGVHVLASVPLAPSPLKRLKMGPRQLQLSCCIEWLRRSVSGPCGLGSLQTASGRRVGTVATRRRPEPQRLLGSARTFYSFEAEASAPGGIAACGEGGGQGRS
jgi:hypothetical protein